MVKTLGLLILATVVLHTASAIGAKTGSGWFSRAPFWLERGKLKPKLEERLRDDRAILVSVRSERGPRDPKADLFLVSGIGWVRGEAERIFETVQKYESLKQTSDHFREIKYDAEKSRVFVISQALGYQARMWFQMRPEVVEPRRMYRLHFEVVDGHFIGLRGFFEFKSLRESRTMTELSVRIEHEAREIPIPRIFVGFALEIVVQKVAERVRTYLEAASAKTARRDAWRGYGALV